MLNKNIYLIYPPGYSGSYLSWCIHKSEVDSTDSTVDSPVNTTENNKYGGVGTSHLHHRIPTHAGIRQLIPWLILNQPKDKRVYLLNSWSRAKLGDTINYIIQMDRDPVIIHITADDQDTRALGNINGITKWPLYFAIRELDKQYNLKSSSVSDMQVRNSFVINYDNIFPTSYTLDFDAEYDPSDDEDTWNYVHNEYTKWYNLRNEFNPHEVNDTMYVPPIEKPKHYYSINLMDVYKDSFPELLSNILNEVEVGTFDFSYVKNYHQTYLNAQAHIRYVEEITKFRETKVLTEYLNSHPLIQALVIKEIIHLLPSDYNWETKTLQEIVKAIQS